MNLRLTAAHENGAVILRPVLGAEESAVVCPSMREVVIFIAVKNLALNIFNAVRDSSFVSLRTACGSSG